MKDFAKYHKKRITIVGYLISRKPVPTEKGHMSFGTWIDRTGEYFDTTHFVEVLKRYPFDAAGCYLIEGTVERLLLPAMIKKVTPNLQTTYFEI